ncbi:hypothetical protein SLEP1_g3686 [Rubroshorea leprosula]|uniref:Uncharacterized protein n=1 Tax=Rubroshorea leprosula TaxID=152421 RepID=A0AAV5HX09_9ROSI|nr:hypothetical protein SLEP1_g3686 [Rubroshorea leprosula]
MASSSSSHTSALVDFGTHEYDYKGPSRFCFCGLKAPRIMSWSEKNHGRRAKEVISWLHNNKTELETNLDDARERIKALRNVLKCYEEKGEQQIEALEKQVNDLQMLATMTMVYATKLEKWKKCGQISLVVAVFLAILLAFFLFRSWVLLVDGNRGFKRLGN